MLYFSGMESILQAPVKSRKKLHNAWAMYDWANSAYNLVITSTIFPAYYDAMTTRRDPATKAIIADTVDFFGWQIKNSALFDYSIASAYLLIAFLSPILSAIADIRGNKKVFLGAFCLIGSASCCGLYFFTEQTLSLSVILAALAAVGYCGSLVFYNAYLPEIALPEEQDKVSAKGFSFGYIGSVLLQIACFVFVLKPELFGLANAGAASRLSFLLVGLWWLGWATIPLRVLPKGSPRVGRHAGNIFTHGFRELGKVWHQLRHLPVLKTFLGAFFFYSMGVQTVMLAATIFGSKVLNLEPGQLIGTILVIQLVAIAGAWLMARLSDRFGNFRVLLFVVALWIVVCIAAFFTTKAMEFYILAALVGLIMGGIQSLSRSTYSKLMPETRDTTSFFSFYDVTEKVAIVIGMFSFGLIEQLADYLELPEPMRYSIIALIAFFAIGAIILYLALRKQKAFLL